MSIVSWYCKSKKNMKKVNTKHVRVGKYTVSSHAQNRIVDPKRKLKKRDMIINLLSKKSKTSKTYLHKDGAKQYDRVNAGNRTITRITQKENRVKTIQKYHNSVNGRKYAYRNF